jgi:hypothetical protein
MPVRKRPKTPPLRADVAQARKHATDAVARLVHWMQSDDARISLAATTALLDRAFGKPAQPVDASDDEAGQTYSIVKRVIIDRAANQDSEGSPLL